MRRRDGTPLWITEVNSVEALRRIELRTGAGQTYDEAWLQNLLHRCPEVLPIEQIETGFGRLIPLCRELPLTFGAGKSGALDNIFVTPEGGLLLLEAKLWRNPESRRAVVAQAMEYAAAVFRMDYETLQSAVLRARGSEPVKCSSMLEIVRQSTHDVDEPQFVDAVSRNLRRGRAVIAVVGDGIREDLAALAELLQTHAGHRFTFALIELAIYETPQQNVRIVTPSLLAQTALIERGVVRIEDQADGSRRIVVKELAATPTTVSAGRAIGIGEDEFYELLSMREPALPALLKSFLAKAEQLGIYIDRQSGLNLKHQAISGNPLNLGAIDKNGFVDTSPSTWWGRTRIGRAYNEALAEAIGGFVRDMKQGQESALRTASGKTPRVSDLLPTHENIWLTAMENYVRAESEFSEN